MFAVLALIFIFLAAAATFVRAEPNPNDPGPGDVLIEGKPCMIGWDVDPTGVWKTMDIDLMTGDNFNMVVLMSVATVDGTNRNKNTFSFTCPQVTPHSPIYFYQFSSPATSNKTWTGRFTITDSSNNVVAPSQSTQPDGEKISWGTGSLVSKSPSSASRSGGTSAASSTRSVSSRTSSQSASPSSASTSTVANTTTSAPLATQSTVFTGTNGAGATLALSNIVFQTALALGFAAVGFIVML